ncbi:unnamed protein product [Blepharisma stoltei]|uniref:Uncharacterized protein n=1 Tax=Blepharisma stoltei TaxID=1481888 RepID=A0AAU9JWB5_9CILI|nr:unnamed protein product [Blepharisma stoltei]
MSPLSYALIKSSRRCIDQILNYIINLEDDYKLSHCIHQIRDDVPLLFNTKSLYLVPFLEFLFVRRADKDIIGFYEIREELPMTIFSPVSKIYTAAFTRENGTEKDSAKQNMILVQFWGSPLGYNYTAGSEESLQLLKKMNECETQGIFQTLFIQSLIREKWDYLWPAIITFSVIYWLNLITMIWYIFDPSIYILTHFMVLNGILALYY